MVINGPHCDVFTRALSQAYIEYPNMKSTERVIFVYKSTLGGIYSSVKENDHPSDQVLDILLTIDEKLHKKPKRTVAAPAWRTFGRKTVLVGAQVVVGGGIVCGAIVGCVYLINKTA